MESAEGYVFPAGKCLPQDKVEPKSQLFKEICCVEDVDRHSCYSKSSYMALAFQYFLAKRLKLLYLKQQGNIKSYMLLC
jgi:hypothetical protein